MIMSSEELGVQEVQCDKPPVDQNASDPLPECTASAQPEYSESDCVIPETTPVDSDIPNNSNTEDLIPNRLDNIESMIKQLKETDELYMIRKDTIDALRKTFDESLEKSRTDITFSVIMDVAIVCEKYKKLCNAIDEKKDSTPINEIITSFSNFLVELEQVLERQQVTIFDDMGKKFDPSRNVVEEIQFTNNKDDDLQICEVCSKGYSLRGKIIYLQRVKVNKYQKDVQ